MREFCTSRNIAITAFSTLGSPGSSDDKKTSSNLSLPPLLKNPTVKSIAEAHNRTTAQILLRHNVQRGIIVLPKSIKPYRIKENIDIFDFSLTDDEIKMMNDLDKGEEGRIFHYLIDKGWVCISVKIWDSYTCSCKNKFFIFRVHWHMRKSGKSMLFFDYKNIYFYIEGLTLKTNCILFFMLFYSRKNLCRWKIYIFYTRVFSFFLPFLPSIQLEKIGSLC